MTGFFQSGPKPASESDGSLREAGGEAIVLQNCGKVSHPRYIGL
jgi:hypothetical protein